MPNSCDAGRHSFQQVALVIKHYEISAACRSVHVGLRPAIQHAAFETARQDVPQPHRSLPPLSAQCRGRCAPAWYAAFLLTVDKLGAADSTPQTALHAFET